MRALSKIEGIPSLRRVVGPHGAKMPWPWLLVCVAWGVALVTTLGHQRPLLDHTYLLRASHLPWPVAGGIFMAGWQVMIAAMMLPASMPVVALLAQVTTNTWHRRRMQGMFLVGFSLVWTGYAGVLITGDALVHSLVDHAPWLAAHTWLIGAATLALAGCIELAHAARNGRQVPDRLIVDHFVAHNRSTAMAGWQVGLFHGASSVGRCWALMLLLFGVGLGGLGWMLALTVAMVAQAWSPGSRRPFALVLGTVLLRLAVVWLAHPIWLVRGAGV